MFASNIVSARDASFRASSLELDGFASCALPGICLDGKQRTFETEWFTSDVVAIQCPNPPRKGARMRVFVEVLGRLEGKVTVRTPLGFRLALAMNEGERAKFRRLIGAMKFRAAAGLPLGRRHERIVPLQRKVIVADRRGGFCSGRIIEVSRSGAAVKVEGAFEGGEDVRIGERTDATVVRLIEGGVAVQFRSLIPFEEFTKRVRL